VIDKDGSPYSADIRGVLKGYADTLHEKKGYTLTPQRNRGFSLPGQRRAPFNETGKFEYVNTGGLLSLAAGDPLRTFIDTTAEVAARHGLSEWKRTIPRSLLTIRNQL